MAKYKTATERRTARVRRAIKVGAGGRPRLSVFRSSKHIYAQLIDDAKGETIAAATLPPYFNSPLRSFIWLLAAASVIPFRSSMI